MSRQISLTLTFFMKLCLLLTFCVTFLYVTFVDGATSPMNIQVTLRGKKYPMNVSKISEIHKIIEEKSGLQADQQALLFKGKMLPRSFGERILKKGDNEGEEIENEGEDSEGEPDLASFGVHEGDTLNIVPQKTQRTPTTSNTQNNNPFGSGGLSTTDTTSNNLSSTFTSSSSSSISDTNPFAAFGANQAEIFAKVRDILGDETLSAFNDLLPDDFPRNPEELTPEKLEELQQHLSNLPQEQQQKLLQAQQQMIIKLLRSPLIEEYLTDDNLEFIRQRLITLPEVKENLPAMIMEILQDATKFKDSIKQLIEVYRMMPEGGFPGMGGMGGMGGMPGMGGMGGSAPDFTASNPFGSDATTSQSSTTSSTGTNTNDGVDDLPEDDRNSEL